MTVSDNGLEMIFRQGEESNEISLVQVDINQLKCVSKINIKLKIQELLDRMKGTKNKRYDQMLKFWNKQLVKCSLFKIIDI